jgi:hypothetical protein
MAEWARKAELVTIGYHPSISYYGLLNGYCRLLKVRRSKSQTRGYTLYPSGTRQPVRFVGMTVT